jgi:starch synthase (maltosyl-transferring)
MSTLNRIRREHPSMQRIDSLRFLDVDGEDLLAYTHHVPAGTVIGGRVLGGDDTVICVVNLHPTEAREGIVHLDPAALGLPAGAPYRVLDELDGTTYTWGGSANYVRLDPAERPAHILAVPRP